MLENKSISSFLGFVLVFAFLPSLEAKVYWVNRYPAAEKPLQDGVSTFPQPLENREQEKPDAIELVFNVIKQLLASRQKSKKHYDAESVEHKCARLFGSIYGTKQQRLQCLEHLKKKRQTDKYHEKHTNNLNEKHFTDLTRAEDISDANIRTDIFYSPEFSTDYIDFKNLRTNHETVEYLDNLRKSNRKRAMDYIQHQRTYYTSDSDSDESVEVKETNKKSSKKLKRFQIIDNDQSSEKTKGSTSSSDNTDDSSEEYKSAKPTKDINRNNEHYLQGNYESSDLEDKKPAKVGKKKEHYLQGFDDFSEDEFEEPVKTNKNKNKSKKKSNQKKEFYLQGGRLISPSSVEDGRRRLQHFLPKRFHWSEEDIHNLGYFWFNGPQGRDPYFPKRP